MDIIRPPQWSPSFLQDESLDSMFDFIYEGQDGYEPEYQNSKHKCHAIQPLNAITTGDELAGSDRSGLLSQLLQTVFGGTTVLGQVEIEEMIKDGRLMSLMICL